MEFAGMNYYAIPLAALASFMFGAVWYGVLSKPWLEAVGKTEADIKAASEGYPIPPAFVIAIVSQLIMAWVLAGLIGHLGQNQVTVSNGLISAAFVWVGFVVTTQATNYGFQGQKFKLTVIDSGHWLGVLFIQGLIIGSFGV
ncbi:MAG: DUF1761 domain-containing protein [Pseudomonadota bacterium]